MDDELSRGYYRAIWPVELTDKRLSAVSVAGNLLFHLLKLLADDAGTFVHDPALVRSGVFPRRRDVQDEQVEKWLDELASHGLIVRFTVGDEAYGRLADFEFQPRRRNGRTVRRYPPMPNESHPDAPRMHLGSTLDAPGRTRTQQDSPGRTRTHPDSLQNHRPSPSPEPEPEREPSPEPSPSAESETTRAPEPTGELKATCAQNGDGHGHGLSSKVGVGMDGGEMVAAAPPSRGNLGQAAAAVLRKVSPIDKADADITFKKMELLRNAGVTGAKLNDLAKRRDISQALIMKTVADVARDQTVDNKPAVIVHRLEHPK